MNIASELVQMATKDREGGLKVEAKIEGIDNWERLDEIAIDDDGRIVTISIEGREGHLAFPAARLVDYRSFKTGRDRERAQSSSAY